MLVFLCEAFDCLVPFWIFIVAIYELEGRRLENLDFEKFVCSAHLIQRRDLGFIYWETEKTKQKIAQIKKTYFVKCVCSTRVVI